MADRLAWLAPRFVSGYLDTRHDAPEQMLPAASRLWPSASTPRWRSKLWFPRRLTRPLFCSGSPLRRGPQARTRLQSRPPGPAISVRHAGHGVRGQQSLRSALYRCASGIPWDTFGRRRLCLLRGLNRKPPPFASLDFVCHTTCAIVHAADDRSVMETIECLPHVIRSGRALFGNRHYRIGPGTIGTRTSPFGSDPPRNPRNGRVTMVRRDPRQRGLLGLHGIWGTPHAYARRG